MKLLVCLMIALLPLVAAAAPETETLLRLNCWDGTYFYNTLKVSDSEDGPHLLHVELASENQEVFFKDVALSPKRSWGQSKVTFFVGRNQCKETTPGRGDLLDCETKNGILEISYRESQESHKVLSLVIRDLKFQTSLSGNLLVANLNFDAGSLAPGAVQLSFGTKVDGTCRGFH